MQGHVASAAVEVAAVAVVTRVIVLRSAVVSVMKYTGLFKMIVGVLTTCHAQYT